MTSSALAATADARVHAVDSDAEAVRDARARYGQARLGAFARRLLTAWGLVVGAGILATLAFVHGGPSFSVLWTALYVVLYAVASRVEFEIGSGSAIPTQLVFVPMLFALPLRVVPAVVAAGLVLRTVGDRPWPLRDPARVFPQLGSAAHALGPVLVIALAGGLPLRWSAWPVYLAALGAEFAFDYANAAANAVANRIPLRELPHFVWLAYAVDAALAPVGLAIAFAAVAQPAVVVVVLPLIGLLRYFSLERRRRIDNALELSDAYRGTAFLLGDVVEADDEYTGSHSRHVVELVLDVCDELGLDASDRRDAEFVALLHDVGKIRIPAEIINKPGPLDDRERAVIETHTILGEEMLERVGGLLGHVGRLVRSCHERHDGNGYPDGLAGGAIPIVSRIVCACDAFSAMTTDRPYRKARSEVEALAELERCSGTHFDPQVVRALATVRSARHVSSSS
ncbi:MAG TPA: HD-GYP domain-containing protein [Gaiellaceae bacterium]|jgi:HD-GYP domain-containing protein (c-di-GMP phosphodiesterase class II)